MIKYQYAKDETGRLIDINSLNEKNRNVSKFFCVGCGNEVIARLGKIKIYHFAHKKVVTCSGETYLHLLGKQIFFDNYNDCLANKKPFFIEIYQKTTCNHYEQDLNLQCKLEKNIIKFDLTQFFDKISLETRESSFVADILLTSKSDKDKVFIEIAVTHLSTEQKLNSDYRIIEIKIESEEDFEPIINKSLSVDNSKVKFKNFKTKDKITSICGGDCKIDYDFLTLDKEGRCLLKQRNLKQIKQQITSNGENIVKYEISKNVRDNYSEIFKKGVATFANDNLNIKNCFICRYHAENNSWDDTGIPIFCKFLKIKCNSNKAVTCEYFKIEKKYVTELLEIHQEEETDEYSQDMEDLNE